MTENLPQRAERLRVAMPRAAATATELIIDNPLPFGLVAAGSIVLGRAGANIVRPRNVLEAVALWVVLDFAAFLLIRKGMDSGLLQFRIRDEDGQLVPLSVNA